MMAVAAIDGAPATRHRGRFGRAASGQPPAAFAKASPPPGADRSVASEDETAETPAGTDPAGVSLSRLLQPQPGARLMDVVRILFAIILPPLGVFLQVGLGLHFWLNILLTIFGYVPGIIHAVWVVVRK
jgi:uncharacterized membrane protein YqaE (UPF0057 family)